MHQGREGHHDSGPGVDQVPGSVAQGDPDKNSGQQGKQKPGALRRRADLTAIHLFNEVRLSPQVVPEVIDIEK